MQSTYRRKGTKSHHKKFVKLLTLLLSPVHGKQKKVTPLDKNNDMNNDIPKAPQGVNVIVLLLGHCVTSIFSLTDVKAAGLSGTVQMIKVENC